MSSLKETIKFIIVATSMCMLIGCNQETKLPKMDAVADSFSTPQESLKAEHNAAKYDQSVQAETSSIDNAIELSQKYAVLTEENAKVKEKNKKITEENQKYKENIAVLQTKLDQSKKELSEANDLLVEMRIELNNWKADILGFRDEMREAQQAQLEALLKVLTILGGQANTPMIETTAPEETIQEETVQQEVIQPEVIQPEIVKPEAVPVENLQSPNEPNNAVENTPLPENETNNTTGQENG